MWVYWQWSHHSTTPPKVRGPAGFDGLHQAMLMQGQRMGLPVGGAVLSKDVGQLQGWPRTHFRTRLGGGGGLAVGPVCPAG